MNVIETPLEGVLLFEPTAYTDERGFFLERFHASRSANGALRGLHFQRRCPQGKLVEVTRGRVSDVVADVRTGSSMFVQWHSVELSDENQYQLWVSPGLAHGFRALSEDADFLYKCTAYYNPENEGGIAWNDPDLDISGPVQDPLLSTKAERLPNLCKLEEGDLPLLPLSIEQ